MSGIVLHIVLGFFALLGIASVVRNVSLEWISVEDRGRYWLLVLTDRDSDLRIKGAVNRLQWDSHAAGGILAVDAGMDEDVRRACEIVAAESDAVRLMTPEEFKKWLGGQTRERDDRIERNGG